MDNGLTDKIMIGQLLVQEGLIDEKQLQAALSEQGRPHSYRPLGEILVGRGFITRRAFHRVLVKHRKQIRLGELLVKMGVISSGQLVQALEIQGRSARKLGQILVERELVTRSQLVDAICVQLGITGIDSRTGDFDRALLDKVNAAFLKKTRAVPLKYASDRRVLLVLMEDPTDTETIADLEKMFRAEIEPVMLRDASFDDLLEGVLDVWSLSR